jgi:murein DD-endopeptidase MepM/ murein hydrolase activator NlpD
MILLTELPRRGTDAWGCGDFGASRDGGKRTHSGIDYTIEPGGLVRSPVSGVVTKLGFPYGDDLSYRYVQVSDRSGRNHRFFYVDPIVVLGENIEVGDLLGAAQDIAERYAKREPGRQRMTNHVHYEVMAAGKFIDPDQHDGSK